MRIKRGVKMVEKQDMEFTSSHKYIRVHLPMWETWVRSLGWEDPQAGKIPGERNSYPLQYSGQENSMNTKTGRLQSMGSQGVGQDWVTFTFTFHKWKILPGKVSVAQSYPTLCNPRDCSLPSSSRVGCHALLRGSSWPGIEPGFPALQANSLPTEPHTSRGPWATTRTRNLPM